MFVLFFLVWVIFNGQLTLEIALFGVAIAGAMYWFICKFLNYKLRYDLFFLKKAPLLIHYLVTLIIEILKANGAVFKMIYSAKYELEPAIVHFKTDLQTTFARVLLANSITLTPGTITISVENDRFCVHCLDKELAEGMEESVFVDLLEEMEAKEAQWNC